MADQEKPRAVSGEIMTDRPDARASRAAAAGDVVDAEFISLSPGPVRTKPTSADPARPSEAVSSIGTASAPVGGMDMLRRGQAAGAPLTPARGGPLFWATGTGLILAAFWISGGHALMHGVPLVGTEITPSALTISGVTSRVEASGQRPVLLVDGEAANGGAAVEHLPALEIAVTGNDGRVTRYRLGTSGRPMASGETFAFSSRLDVPKNGVRTVSVAFAE